MATRHPAVHGRLRPSVNAQTSSAQKDYNFRVDYLRLSEVTVVTQAVGLTILQIARGNPGVCFSFFVCSALGIPQSRHHRRFPDVYVCGLAWEKLDLRLSEGADRARSGPRCVISLDGGTTASSKQAASIKLAWY